MSTLSNRKPSAEESSAEVDEEMNEVRLKIKAVEHWLKGGKSDPSADIHDVVPIYRKMSQDCLQSTLQQLQDEKNILLKMKLDIRNKGAVINDNDGNNFIDIAFAAVMYCIWCIRTFSSVCFFLTIIWILFAYSVQTHCPSFPSYCPSFSSIVGCVVVNFLSFANFPWFCSFLYLGWFTSTLSRCV